MNGGMSTAYVVWRIKKDFPDSIPHQEGQQQARDLE
ncbi:hypothetical protein BFJ63_vAg11171 [Fusarium oxysporum f. sp. narcissi]|uniref:Uncharacterized protein n=1 Tax=Fusarium oxysporum f. sp. narcissi TaxID=451672 RepID=A0A4Q2VEA9_FUSOX|nr:hypothetical protein BFJ63_vAg11171 [Fusarium oxysporum f. sp. narcissi]